MSLKSLTRPLSCLLHHQPTSRTTQRLNCYLQSRYYHCTRTNYKKYSDARKHFEKSDYTDTKTKSWRDPEADGDGVQYDTYSDTDRDSNFIEDPSESGVGLMGESAVSTPSLGEVPLSSVNTDCAELFRDPGYFKLPVLIIHAQYSDCAVSFHAPDRLNEVDCLWSYFPRDEGFYGTFNRTSAAAIYAIMDKARERLSAGDVTKCRLVIKGFNTNVIRQTVRYLDQSVKNVQFVSITDMTRRMGEESLVYQRPVPRYPNKKSADEFMTDSPEWAPTTLLEKFRSLNVYHVDKPDTTGIQRRGRVDLLSGGRLASKRGFIVKKSGKKTKDQLRQLEIMKEIE